MKGTTQDKGLQYILLSKIKRNTLQPRVVFDKAKLQELASNINHNGLLQPIVVRQVQNHFVIIAGERRYRAHTLLKKKQIQARVIICDDKTAYELTLLENIQREDLNLLEEARGYIYLRDKYSYKLKELSKVTGKSMSNISNIMSILEEQDDIKEYVKKGILTLAAYVWVKQLPNHMEKLQLLQKIEEEEVKRSKIREYVERVTRAYELAKKFGLKPQDMLKQRELLGSRGRYDIKEDDIFPSDFQFFFIVDFVMSASDLSFMPVKNLLFSAYNFIHDKNASKRLGLMLLERKKISKLFLDSGVMPATRKKHWSYFAHVDKILDLYDTIEPDICVNIDVPMYPFVLKTWKISKKDMRDITKANSIKFRDWKPNFKTIKVFPLQGTTPQEYLDCFYMYKNLGIFNDPNCTFGFGGLATAPSSHQINVVKFVMANKDVQQVRKNVPFVHGFGIGNPKRIIELYKLGVNSFDALTTVILSIMGQYWLRDGKYARHIIHETPLTRPVRLHFNMLSFWGQLAEKFATLKGVQLTDTKEIVTLKEVSKYYDTNII